MKRVGILLGLFATVFLVSCKHDADITAPVKYTGDIMVGFNNYESAEGGLTYKRTELTFSDSFQDLGVEVKLSNTTETAPADIYVYLTKVDALVSNYNTSNGGSLTTVSNISSGIEYDFSKPVIIKQGTRKATVPLKVNPVRLAASGANAVGLAILRVEGANATVTTASQQAKLVVEFTARNRYDGVYNLNVKTTGWGAYGIADGTAGDYPAEVHLITSGPSSVTLDIPAGLGNLQPAIDAAGNGTAFGATTPQYTFDDATNKMTAVVNTTPDDGRGRRLSINAAAPNTNDFNPTTRTIRMNYTMFQTGRPNQLIEQRLTYIGPR